MLESLHIKNLALFTEQHLDFSSGLNTVSGETGAGKSLVIGAIQLLSGMRASSAIIRRGSTSCEVSAVFNLSSLFPALQERVNFLLEEAALPPCEDKRLLIRRSINENGSRAFVNSSAVTAAFLRELTEFLIDIHGPNDNQSLLKQSKQLQILDSFAKEQKNLQSCKKIWLDLQETRSEYEELQKENIAPEEIQLYKYQLQEIQDAQIKVDEEEELLARHKIVANSKRMLEIASDCAEGIYEDENSLSSQLSQFLRMLREIALIDLEEGAPLAERLEAIIEQTNELGQDLNIYCQSLNPDEEELQELEDRMELLQALKRKYGKTLSEVLECALRLETRLAAVDSKDEQLEALLQKEKELSSEHLKVCKKLHDGRSKAAKLLSKEISEKLLQLGFDQAIFDIRIEEKSPGINGSDNLEFVFAPNTGEEKLPLRLIASSGEIARVMLALKTVLGEADKVPILVFDEVDANIGGRVAGSVAEELQKLANFSQIFCVTHLPIIAAAGQSHFMVNKKVEDKRTVAEMHKLDKNNRIQELARMLGAAEDSKSAINHAKEMLGIENA